MDTLLPPMSLVPCSRPGCRARIAFALTAKLKRQPLDALPFEREQVARAGRWVIEGAGEGARAVRDDRIDTAERVYVSHYATCPAVVTAHDLARYRTTQPALAARIEAYRA